MALNLKTTRSGQSNSLRPFCPEEAVDLTEDDDNEAPVDLSQGRHNRIEEEVVMTFSSEEEKRRVVERLQNELKGEEASLVLMKKLKVSGDKSTSAVGGAQKNQRVSLSNNQNISVNRQNVSTKQQQQQPNRGQQLNASNKTSNNNNNNNIYKRSAYSQQQQNNNNNSSSRFQSNSTVNNNNNKLNQYSNYLNNQASKTNGTNNNINNNTTSQQQKFMQEQQRKLLEQQQQTASIIVEQTAAQKLAAAKQAVNKQLEQSLQQLSSLVTTPFDLILIPSSNHLEYAASVGLEAVVNHLLFTDPPSNKAPEPLRQCSLCSCDYSSKWMSRKDGKVWCEGCYRRDKKRLVARQQEEKIGALLVRASTQERNIEKALALELEAARQQIEVFNNSLATAVSSAHKSSLNHRHPPSSSLNHRQPPSSSLNHRSLDASRCKALRGTNNPPSSSNNNKSRSSKTPHDTSSKHLNNLQSASSSAAYKSLISPNDLERLMLGKDNYLSLINPSAFVPSSSPSSSAAHHTHLRTNKPYSRP